MNDYFPIEMLLNSIQQQHPTEFPENISYFSRYDTALGKLRNDHYKTTNVGLALLSKPQGLFTDHGPEHFDEVVRYLGELVPTDHVLPHGAVTPYELFVILMAARIHDAGNKDGREGHEIGCFAVLEAIGDGADKLERSIIAKIAQAHSGKSLRGCKDTISDIPISKGFSHITFNPRKCAALVRIADEICENRKRAFDFDFSNEQIKANELFHVYASCISRNSFSQPDRLLTLEFDIPCHLLERKFVKATEDNTDILFIEEVAIKLEKLDIERKYCNAYLPESLRVRGIKAVIRAYKEEKTPDGKTLPLNPVEITQHDFQDVGYPAQSDKLISKWPELSPDNFTKLVNEKINPYRQSTP